MTKREEAIEAMGFAIADNIDGCTPGMAHYPATAAFDAAVKVLSEPDEGMIRAVREWSRAELSPEEATELIFDMLKAAAR